MRRSRFRSMLTVLAFLLLAGWCYFVYLPGEAPAPEEIVTVKPTGTLGPTPTPALVDFDSICQEQKTIQVEGFLHIPDSVACSDKGEEEYCNVQLTDLISRNQILVSLPVDGERTAPVSNHMLSLPIPYEAVDFMVAAYDGQWAGEGSPVRLTGRTESFGYDSSENVDCKLVHINKIEKLERFSLAGEKARQATLRAAIKEGWVDVSITGDGLSRIDLRIQPKVSFNLNLEIEVGTIFLSEAGNVQNMVVRKQSFVYVKPELETEIELDVSCANMRKKEPRRENTFTVQPELAPEDLINLINLAEFAFEPVRLQQLAIWTVTDNPSQDGYVGLSASFSSEGSGPTDDELARIKELFQMAGLDADSYSALQE